MQFRLIAVAICSAKGQYAILTVLCCRTCVKNKNLPADSVPLNDR